MVEMTVSRLLSVPASSVYWISSAAFTGMAFLRQAVIDLVFHICLEKFLFQLADLFILREIGEAFLFPFFSLFVQNVV